MTGLADYIKWLGRFSFAELPLCEADILVLCDIAYYDVAPALRDGTAQVSDCSEGLESGAIRRQITGAATENSAIFRAAIASKRFGALRITDYEDILDPELPLQFSAMTFRWDGGGFIAFRGTDETIAGWKEDFMISFTETMAQKLAAVYAEQILTAGGRYSIGGHSKGANLALYAACRLSDEAWERVDRVWLLDGPGLCPEVMDVSLTERVNEKATRILPEFSVVGKLFEPHIADTRIVKSSASGIAQHSLATWQVEYGDLALADGNDRRSVSLMEILNRWIAGLSEDERRALTDDLFGPLAAGGAVTLSDIAGNGPLSFEAALLKMFHASEVTRKMLRELPQQFRANLRLRLTGEEPE